MIAVSERMLSLGTAGSDIREAAVAAWKRAQEIGPENVDNYTIGNPSVPPPAGVAEAIRQLLSEKDPMELFGYTISPGDDRPRQALAEDLNRRFGTTYSADDFYLTCGAAASLSCVLSALCCPGDSVLTIAPFFPEYTVFAETAGATLVPVPARDADCQPDLPALSKAINEHTKALIINTPNNPTGVVYSGETLNALGEILREKSREFGHPIWLISDEPYREIYFGKEPIPWVPSYYANTLVCYSYSKSLSLPGARIGYVLVPPDAEEDRRIFAAVAGAGRALGYVCAPSLFQFVAEVCAGETADLSIYRKNRDILLPALREYGYDCPQAEGAFYLFPKTPTEDAKAFCEKAREYDLFLVPGDSFGMKGHIRISYCVQTEQIQRSLWKFKKLAEDFGL